MTTKTTHTEFCNALYALSSLDAKLKNTELSKEYLNNLKLWNASIFKIVVMGEIKKGKSSFINAMLGFENLVPVSSNVATSTIFKICYGEKVTYRVFFTLDSQKPAINISPEQLKDYGTEDGNPNNEKQVDFIQVLAPSPILKSGLVIIDTPGLGGLFKSHKQITYSYVPKADAVFLVTDSTESPIGRDELDLLKDLKEITDQIYFVQTKGTAVDTEARLARRENNLNILADNGFDKAKLKYFVLDSQLRFEADEAKDAEDLVDSGYPQVMSFVNNAIRPNVQNLIKAKAMLESRPMIDSVASEISMREEILNADTKEKQVAIREEIAALEEEISKWNTTYLPKINDEFSKGLRDIRKKALDFLESTEANSTFHMEFEKKIDECETTQEILDVLNSFNENASGFVFELEFRINDMIKTGSINLLASFSQYLKTADISSTELALSNYSNAIVTRDNEAVFNEYSFTRSIEQIERSTENIDKEVKQAIQLTPASKIAGTVGSIIGMIAGTCIGDGATGTIIGRSIGSKTCEVVAGCFVKDGIRQKVLEKNLSQAKIQASGTLTQAFGSVNRFLSKRISDSLGDIESLSSSSLKEKISEMNTSLGENKERLALQNKQSVQEITKAKNELNQLKASFDSAMKVISNA